MSPNIQLFSGTKSRYLAEAIAQEYGITLGKYSCPQFADGECEPSFDEPIRGKDVFLIQSTFAPADNLMELLMMIDAAKRASARQIVAVIPYFGYARQDRKSRPRVSIGAKLVADMLTVAGVSRVITVDLHADQIQGFFNIPVDHLYSSQIFCPFIEEQSWDPLVIASPDVGGSKRVSTYAKYLGVEMVLCHKVREKANEVSSMRVIGDVRGKNVVIVDDMIDTAGTLTTAANMLKDVGAKSVRAFAAHGLFSGDAMEKIEKSVLQEVYITDSILQKEHLSAKIKVKSLASFISAIIRRVYSNQSISGFYLKASSAKQGK